MAYKFLVIIICFNYFMLYGYFNHYGLLLVIIFFLTTSCFMVSYFALFINFEIKTSGNMFKLFIQ